MVISIMGILSTQFAIQLNVIRLKNRDTTRITNLEQLQIALEVYRSENYNYPKTFEPGGPLVKLMECSGQEYIPGLAPKYILRLPSDPSLNCGGIAHSWVYASDGIDFKLITHPQGKYFSQFRDPAWDGGSDYCIIDGPESFHYGVWTPKAVCWRL